MEVFMSPPSVAPPQVTAQPTRRQLDELDALLQRMLELPVHRTESDLVQPALPGSILPDSGFQEQEREIGHSWQSIQPAMTSFAEAVSPEEPESYSNSHDNEPNREETESPLQTANLTTDRPVYFTENSDENTPFQQPALNSPTLSHQLIKPCA